ncbi:MAG: hypothetical protein PHP46_04485, partial [Candidatus Omnitrophica bacterium]|nr:hypothetical protein [Candidatus Omnitrophota bacterium]
ALSGLASYMLAHPEYTVDTLKAELPKMAEIHTAVSTGSAELKNAFATIYGIAVADQLFTNVNYRYVLSGLANYMISHPEHTISTFIQQLPQLPAKMTALHDAIKNNDSLKNNFFRIYDIAVADQKFDPTDPTNANKNNTAYKALLAGIASYMCTNQYYTVDNFVNEIQKLPELDDAITNNNMRDAFANVYNIATAYQVFSNTEYKNMLSGIAGYMYYEPSFTIADFVRETQKLHEIDTALNASDNREAFKILYGIEIADQKFTNADYKAILLDVVNFMKNNPGYTVDSYIAELRQFSGLDKADDIPQELLVNATTDVNKANVGPATIDNPVAGDQDVAARLELKGQMLRYGKGHTPQMVMNNLSVNQQQDKK